MTFTEYTLFIVEGVRTEAIFRSATPAGMLGVSRARARAGWGREGAFCISGRLTPICGLGVPESHWRAGLRKVWKIDDSQTV